MNGRVLCVGDTDFDDVIALPHMPGADEKVDGRHLVRAPGGMGANVAVALARLGVPSRLVSVVGDDEDGRAAVEMLAAEGVETTFVERRANARTFTCLAFVVPNGEKSLVRLPSEAYLPSPAALVPAVFDDVTHVHLTFGDPTLAIATIEASRSRGLSLSLDLEAADAPADRDGLRQAVAAVDTLLLSRRSRAATEALIGPICPEHRQIVVTTLGANGAECEGAGGHSHVNGLAVNARDTSGAGDAFAAAFIARRLAGDTAGDALRFANAAGALSTAAYGAQGALPSEAAVRRALVAGEGADA